MADKSVIIKLQQDSGRYLRSYRDQNLISWIGLWLTPLVCFGSGVVAIFGEGSITRVFGSLILLGCAGALVFAGLGGHKFGYSARILFIPAMVCVFTYAVSLAISVDRIELLNSNFVTPLFKLILSLVVVFFVSEQDWNSPKLWLSIVALGNLILGFDLALILFFGIQEDTLTIYLHLHSNSVALFGFVGIIYGVIMFYLNFSKLHNALAITLTVIAFLCVAMTKGRSILISMFVAVGITMLLRYWARYRRLRSSLIVIVASLCLAIPTIYGAIGNSRLFNDVDRLSNAWFGKGIYTGREFVWPIVIDDIYERPWFGYGVESRSRWEWQEYGSDATKLSAHNSYLSILHEAGIFGVAGFAFFVWFVWATLIKLPGSIPTQLCSGFLWAALLQQSFEVSLINGDYLRAICIWSVVGCGLSFINSNLESQK